MASSVLLERGSSAVAPFSGATPGWQAGPIPAGSPAAANWCVLPRCAVEFEKCTGGFKIHCRCEDEVACGTLQNLCRMLCDGLCSCYCYLRTASASASATSPAAFASASTPRTAAASPARPATRPAARCCNRAASACRPAARAAAAATSASTTRRSAAARTPDVSGGQSVATNRRVFGIPWCRGLVLVWLWCGRRRRYSLAE